MKYADYESKIKKWIKDTSSIAVKIDCPSCRAAVTYARKFQTVPIANFHIVFPPGVISQALHCENCGHIGRIYIDAENKLWIPPED